MPRRAKGLTAALVAKGTKPGRFYDGGGLCLLVRSHEAKFWLFRYTRHGRMREMGLGTAKGRNAVSLATARAKARQLHAMVRDGRDPLSERQSAKAKAEEDTVSTFATVARLYLAAHGASWSDKHHGQWRSTLRDYVLPVIGDMPIAAVATADMAATPVRMPPMPAPHAGSMPTAVSNSSSPIRSAAISTMSLLGSPMSDPPGYKIRTFKPKPRKDSEPLDEQTIMRVFVAEHREQLRYNHDGRYWLLWDEHSWKIDRRHRAFDWSLELCRSLPPGTVHRKIRFSRAVEEGARVQPEFATVETDWDRDPWLLGTPGGVVDLRTGELRPGQSADMISKTAGVAPAAQADCPKWQAFLDFALNADQPTIAYLQRYAGYCLTGLTSEEQFVFLAGKEGTGKGTITKTLRGILGAYATTVPITMFTDPNWRALEYYRAQLPGRRLINASEPDADTAWNEGFINELTGSDQLSARHPRGTPFDFDPSHKLLMNGNAIPNLKGAPAGLRRRIGIILCNRAPLVPNTKLKDELRAEGPGILRWMIAGCLDWQQQGLNPPATVKAATAEYFERQDVFARFVAECCDLIPTATVKPSTLRTAFNEWAQKNGEKPMSNNAFHHAVDMFDHPQVRQVIRRGTSLVCGLSLKPPIDNAEEF
jgi:putative DNA primase/helicase